MKTFRYALGLCALLLFAISLALLSNVQSLIALHPAAQGRACVVIEQSPYGAFYYQRLGDTVRMRWYAAYTPHVQVSWYENTFRIDLNNSKETPEYIETAAGLARDAIESGSVRETSRPCSEAENTLLFG